MSSPQDILHLTDEEIQLIETYNLDYGQVKWMRRQIRQFKDLFWQEFPWDPTTCFLSSGRLVFDSNALKKGMTKCYEPTVVKNEFLIWKEPEAGHGYILGADVAEGLADGDYSTAYVMDYDTCEFVAGIHTHLPDHRFAEIVSELGAMYNHALLGIESNERGHAVLNTLIFELKIDKKHVYHHEDYDTSTASEKPGWPTNNKTRPIMVSDLEDAVFTDSITIYDRMFYDEAFSFVFKDNGKPEHQDGAHDDRIFAAGICWQLRKRKVKRSFLDFLPAQRGQQVVFGETTLGVPIPRSLNVPLTPRCPTCGEELREFNFSGKYHCSHCQSWIDPKYA